MEIEKVIINKTAILERIASNEKYMALISCQDEFDPTHSLTVVDRENVVLKEILENSEPLEIHKIDLTLISTYEDGTTEWLDKNDYVIKLKRFYLDNRPGSVTKGELFSHHPNTQSAVMLDKSLYNFLET